MVGVGDRRQEARAAAIGFRHHQAGALGALADEGEPAAVGRPARAVGSARQRVAAPGLQVEDGDHRVGPAGRVVVHHGVGDPRAVGRDLDVAHRAEREQVFRRQSAGGLAAERRQRQRRQQQRGKSSDHAGEYSGGPVTGRPVAAGPWRAGRAARKPRGTATPAGAAAARGRGHWIQSVGMGGVGTEVVVVLVLLLANGVFAMSEISIVAARKVRLQQRADDGDRMAKAALALANAPSQFLSTVQIGISLVGVLAGAYGGATIAKSLQARLEQIPSVAPYAEGLALGLVVAVITYLSLIIGELVPKRIGLNHPETIASWVAIPMMGLARIGAPLVALLTGSTNLVLRIFGIKGQIDPHLTEDEIRAVISQGAESGALESEEESLVQRVFRVGDQRVGAIMTPRLDIEWVDVNATDDELREFLGGHSHGQFVVCKASLDNVLGTVRAADLLTMAMKGAPINLKALVQEPLFVPDSMGIFKLLEALKASHRHMAIVLDEFGAVEGLVTVTDLLEAFVGSLPTDRADERAIVARPDGSWLVDGATPIDDVVSDLGLDELPEDEAGAYHTLGGFVMARLGRIPRTADSFEWSGMRFEVVDMDGRRIDKVLVNRLAPAEAAIGEVSD